RVAHQLEQGMGSVSECITPVLVGALLGANTSFASCTQLRADRGGAISVQRNAGDGSETRREVVAAGLGLEIDDAQDAERDGEHCNCLRHYGILRRSFG